MWNIGFRRYLEEILTAFKGEVSCRWSKDSINFELVLKLGEKPVVLEQEEPIEPVDPGDELIVIQLIEDGVKLQEELSYNELYDVLVTGTDMSYLYLFQDVIEELNDPESRSIMVNQYLGDVFQKMIPVLLERKGNMVVQKVETPVEIVSGMRFIDNGIEYEQLAMAI